MLNGCKCEWLAAVVAVVAVVLVLAQVEQAAQPLLELHC
jgi:hypothetical protein